MIMNQYKKRIVHTQFKVNASLANQRNQIVKYWPGERKMQNDNR